MLEKFPAAGYKVLPRRDDVWGMKRIALALLVITACVHFGQLAIAKFQTDMNSKISRLDRIGGER